ncbi:GntR family transcriptional regulator [bacterium]|nr:GntR family transcriptional regulator [bacterium]
MIKATEENAKSRAGRKSNPYGVDVQHTIDILSEAIYSGHLLPNARLVESALMTEHHLTRTKVRQVLAELASSGLVIIQHNKGATVANITISRILEMYEVVAVLEGAAARLATARIDDSDISQLKDVLQQQRSIMSGESKKWRFLNNSFHRIIILKCGNGELINIIRKHSQFTNYWFTAFGVPPAQENITDHEKIIQALIARDVIQTGILMESHIMKGGRYVVDYLKKNIPFVIFKS